MATGEQIKSLIQSVSAGNREHFVSVAMQIASQAARTGKEKLARELRDLVDEVKKEQAAGVRAKPLLIARPAGELAGLLTATYPKTLLNEMVLGTDLETRLNRVLREYRHQNRLREHRLSARRKLLLVGPPGCGKTMTASALAGELKLPLFSVQIHGLITKFMGETAAKLHVIFDAMYETRGVYLFDEFDAIGSNRGAKNDVGEIRRVLNSFLQFLEQDDSESLIIAATNHAEMLDNALFRRFDDVLEYITPSPEQVKLLIENRLQRFGLTKISWTKVQVASAGLSHAEVARSCDDAAKDCILEGKNKITTQLLVQAISERSRGTRY